MRPLRELLDQHPLPDLSGGKDDSGTLLVVGGPPECPGAVLLAGLAALRVGAGRVQLVVDPAVAPAAAVARAEALVVPWDQRGAMPDEVGVLVEQASAVLVGPGHSHMDVDAVVGVVARARCPVVLDAGALSVEAWPRQGEDVVLAPNPTEAATLIGCSPDHPPHLASALAARVGGAVAVRGATTAIAAGADLWSFDAAPPGLGTPGSGDVFMGVLGALLAGGMPTAGALGWAVELHASAGRLLAAETPVGYLAGEIADRLPEALSIALGRRPRHRGRSAGGPAPEDGSPRSVPGTASM